MSDPSGREVILADSIDGKPFSRLNDLVVGRNDRIYFTDENGVSYLPPGGKVTAIHPVIANPNGVMLSPDEKMLTNDKDGQYVIRTVWPPMARSGTAATSPSQRVCGSRP